MTLPDAVALFWPSLIAGLAIAIFAGLLSPLVVLRKMAFVGQGISHAAFGGAGIAAILGLTAPTLPHAAGTLIIVAAVCILCGVLIASFANRSAASEDTLIGIFLVAFMALGSILLTLATHGTRLNPGGPPPVGVEAWLFGSILDVTRADALLACIAAIAIAATLIAMRRSIAFWAFDEPGAQAFGINTPRVRLTTMVLLAIAVVAAMKLAGAVLATALLVLPGAIALRLSQRLAAVIALSLITATLGVAVGLALAFTAGNLPAGPCIVAVLVAAFMLAHLAKPS
ncbi:MAG: metal ABC transporter permease [Phycisphaerales bacterium]